MDVGTGVTLVAESVLRALDLDRAVELVQEVCRIPSVLGDEGALAAFLAPSVMRDSAFDEVELQPVLEDRPNAVGHVSFGGGPTVVLTGHMDTKPASHGWSITEPFSGALIDGAVYGHGVMDMKAALACQIVAIERTHLDGEAATKAVTGTQIDPGTEDPPGGQRHEFVPRLGIGIPRAAPARLLNDVVLYRREVRQPESHHLFPLPVLLEPAAVVTPYVQGDDQQARYRSLGDRQLRHRLLPVADVHRPSEPFGGRHHASLAWYHAMVAARPASKSEKVGRQPSSILILVESIA